MKPLSLFCQLSVNLLWNSKLFFIILIAGGIFSKIISCKKPANEYRVVLIEETIILKGTPSLCIFGKAYAFGKMESLDRRLLRSIPYPKWIPSDGIFLTYWDFFQSSLPNFF